MLWLYLGRAAPALAAAVLLFGAAAHAVPLTFVSQNVTAAADAIMDGFPLDEDEDIETGSVSSFAFASAFISQASGLGCGG